MHPFPEVAMCGSVEVTCFQYLEAIQALDAIRLTKLLQKATLDPRDNSTKPVDQRHVSK